MKSPFPFRPSRLKSLDAIKRRLKKNRIPISKKSSGAYKICTEHRYFAPDYDLETFIEITKHDLWVARIPESDLQKRLEEALGSPAYSTGSPPKNTSQDYLQQHTYDFIDRDEKRHRVKIELVVC